MSNASETIRSNRSGVLVAKLCEDGMEMFSWLNVDRRVKNVSVAASSRSMVGCEQRNRLMSDMVHVVLKDGGEGGRLSGGRRGEVRRGECGASGGGSSAGLGMLLLFPGFSNRTFCVKIYAVKI